MNTSALAPAMTIVKRSGAREPVDLTKIVDAVTAAATVDGKPLAGVDPMVVTTQTISGLHDGATTTELDELTIRIAASLIVTEPNYSRLAARLLAKLIAEEVAQSGVTTFEDSIALCSELGLVSAATADFVHIMRGRLGLAIRDDRTDLFEFFGLRTVYDRYLLRHPVTRKVVETPQHFMMRVACGLSRNANEAIDFYGLMSRLEYLPGSPTLFNSGTPHSQMSSCYLLDSPVDSLDAIYTRYHDIARLSKFAGGIGVSYSRIRSRGSLIRDTNGLSNGIVPWLKTLDASVAAVNQGGRRKGAACVYLEPWHADVEEFLELRDNTGDHNRRTHNLNLANWIPDLFMRRVRDDATWSLFDPKVVPHLPDLYGAEFDAAYEKAEEEGLFERQLPARALYERMIRTLAETGNGWMNFKDPSNRRCNQTALPGNVVHLSNLCTEIIEVTSTAETAVCNLGSINLAKLVTNDTFDFERLAEIVRQAVPFLDRVVDINFYPIDSAADSNQKWRPVGLGIMGLQDVFFQLRMPFDSPEAAALSSRISETIYFYALHASTELARISGPHPGWEETRAASGALQFDLAGVEPTIVGWPQLRTRIERYGLRNSLLIAIAPTATIASIAGCYECIEPQVSNLFKRETLSGEFLQINRYLVADLQERGLWTDEVIEALRSGAGSIQHIEVIPEDLRAMYRTVWELPQKALIDMAAERGAFVDQSQSLNLFVESPSIGRLSSMYMYAWEQGLKTTYYLRSRPATSIRRTTATAAAPATAVAVDAAEAIACSLENPESCEACQ